MRILEYRDQQGYIMDESCKPVFLADAKKAQSMQRIARYVYCPESEGLIYIGKCEKCNLFCGHEQYNGVKCASQKEGKMLDVYYKTKKIEWK